MTEQTTTPETDPYELVFEVPNSDPKVQIKVELRTIPDAVRLDLLKGAVRNYIVNSVNQAHMRHTKALEPWTSYENAVAADPMQTAVPKPEGERPTADLASVAAEARKRLYEGKVRKQGEGTKARETKDPLTKQVTQAVVSELWEKRKAEPGIKFSDITKLVAGDGIKYLNDNIDKKVAEGMDRKVLESFRDKKYINPAKMMIGMATVKGSEETSLL